jgi:hypothetical protein
MEMIKRQEYIYMYIMFTKNDNKQTKRKSKSTVSRDHRRMEKYNSKNDNNNQCVEISTCAEYAFTVI